MLDDARLQHADRLALLESRDLIGRVFCTLHNRDLGASKATEILAHLRQGRAYLAAASTADEIVRPLLQYYATLAYARAYILLRGPSLRESALAAGHGLTTVGWKEHFGTGGQWLDARIRVDGGTFTQLATVTRNTSIVRLPHPSGKRLRLEVIGTAAFASRWEFRVRDLLARMPSLAPLYEAIVVQPACCWACRLINMDGVLEVEVAANGRGLPHADLAVSLLGLRDKVELRDGVRNVLGLGPTRTWEAHLPLADLQRVTAHLANVRMDGDKAYLCELLPDGVRLSNVSMLFATAYALGMLVRYYPTHWMSLLSRSDGDHALPLIRAASEAVVTFPNAITAGL